MRIVSPYRPFAPESDAHKALGPFDWVGALAMLAESARIACGLSTVALTDQATTVTIPAYRYVASSPRLMLWILEVSLSYLSSPQFDEDTILISPDTLVFGDLRPYFGGDITVVRSSGRYSERPILNAVQWWPVASQAKLVEFYADMLAVAETLPEPYLQWGADTEPLKRFLAPVKPGLRTRHRLQVTMIESSAVLQSLSSLQISEIEQGKPVGRPTRPLLDFKYTRKRHMRRYFEATIGTMVTT